MAQEEQEMMSYDAYVNLRDKMLLVENGTLATPILIPNETLVDGKRGLSVNRSLFFLLTTGTFGLQL
jgi:hypothetical protein